MPCKVSQASGNLLERIRAVAVSFRRRMGRLSHQLLTIVLVFAAAVANAGVLTNSVAAPKAKKKKSDEIFDNKHVLPLVIEVSTNELKALSREARKYVRATVHEGTNQWRDVGLHLKGAAGSYRNFDDRPALTLHFSKFTPDQRFHGLKKIHLNNSVQDASYITENLCGELFRKVGVPAARASYATVELNGRKKGLYVLKEGFEKEMLELYFKNTKGNLYDGGFLREVTDQPERDQGGGDDDVNDWSDLKALAKASQEPDTSKRFEELGKVLDVERFIAFTAMEIMAWDWDGYPLNRNNYRVYHDLDTGKIVFFPHGMDQMFWQPEGPIMPNMNGLVAQALLKTSEGRRLYRERFGQIFTNVFQIEMLTNRVNEIATLVRGALTNLHGAQAGKDYDGQSKRMMDLIVARHASLTKQLAVPQPKPLAFLNNIARVGGWEVPANIVEQGTAKRDKSAVDGKQALHIQATSPSSASWRTRVLLEQGRYRFEVSAKTAGVAAITDSQKGEGAGIRISGSQAPRPNKLSGDARWQNLAYEFDVAGADEEVVLICELRASKGDVWFDADSTKLVKLK
jgi:spore coat protein H